MAVFDRAAHDGRVGENPATTDIDEEVGRLSGWPEPPVALPLIFDGRVRWRDQVPDIGDPMYRSTELAAKEHHHALVAPGGSL
jgi:hypothetical protein